MYACRDIKKGEEEINDDVECVILSVYSEILCYSMEGLCKNGVLVFSDGKCMCCTNMQRAKVRHVKNQHFL